jgi:Fe2+ or Zn2+ uptake regulation protein
MRSNEYKQTICDILEKHHLLNLSEIHTEIPDAHFASIYRNVESLCKDGTLKKVVIGKNNVRYELASHGHGHFVCNDCDSVKEVDVPQSIKQNHSQVSDVLIRGLCDNCHCN